MINLVMFTQSLVKVKSACPGFGVGAPGRLKSSVELIVTGRGRNKEKDYGVEPGKFYRIQSSKMALHSFYRQLGCLAFSLRFWPKMKQLLSNYKTKQLLSNFFASVLFLVELRN